LHHTRPKPSLIQVDDQFQPKALPTYPQKVHNWTEQNTGSFKPLVILV
jgi:hypothetical protein